MIALRHQDDVAVMNARHELGILRIVVDELHAPAGFRQRKRGGRIINVASMLSFQGGVRVATYTAAKSGLLGLTRAMANELAPVGINVNAIAPGYMATDNTQALRDAPERSRDILARIPAARWAHPTGAVVYLASAASPRTCTDPS